MNARLKTSFVTAGVAVIMLTGCVSSRKYKASQADVAKLRNDSAQQAQQISGLNGNVSDLQNKNSTLQKQLETSNQTAANTQHALDYYQGYFKDQQAAMSQVSDDVKGALTQAGISNADVQQTNNVIYVRLDENDLFKKGTTVVSKNGKQALDGLTQVFKNRQNVNVDVAADDSAIASAEPMPVEAPAPVHHRIHHVSHSAASSGSGSGSNGTANGGAVAGNSSSTGSKSNTTPAPHKVHHHYSSEGSMAVLNGPHHNHAWVLKQARMVQVANHFVRNGVPKINVTVQNPPDGTPSNAIKVVIKPKMEDFNPHQNSSASR